MAGQDDQYKQAAKQLASLLFDEADVFEKRVANAQVRAIDSWLSPAAQQALAVSFDPYDLVTRIRVPGVLDPSVGHDLELASVTLHHGRFELLFSTGEALVCTDTNDDGGPCDVHAHQMLAALAGHALRRRPTPLRIRLPDE